YGWFTCRPGRFTRCQPLADARILWYRQFTRHLGGLPPKPAGRRPYSMVRAIEQSFTDDLPAGYSGKVVPSTFLYPT
ncbi:hypothetical protein B296_00059142, partial [Ensete ventricosum]